MNATNKSPKHDGGEAPGETRTPEITITEFAMLMHRNAARLIGLNKTALEILGEQTTDVAETLRNSNKSGVAGSVAAMLDLTERGVKSWISLEKELLDMTLRQSDHTVNAFRKRGGSVSHSMQEMADFAQKTTEHTITAQKAVLDFAAEQNKAIAEAVRRQPGVKGSAVSQVTESVERGFDTLIGMQKEFLDNAEKMSRTAAAGRG